MVKPRTSKDIRRRIAFKSPKKVELIVCEGTCTEPAYFNALKQKLRLHAVRVDVMSSEDSEPINIVECAVNKKGKGIAPGIPYNKVWCVIDTEIPPRTFDDALKKAENIDGLEIIFSNPFFEYWFLLHFEKVTTPFNSDRDLHQRLKSNHTSYKKTRIGFDILYPLTETAIKNSKEVLKEKYNDAEDIRNCNPSTHVHKIVEHLQEQS